MSPINAHWEGENATRGNCRAAARPRLAYGHLNNLSGQALLLLGRESAVPSRRANSRECSARARLSGHFIPNFFNARTQFRWQAIADVARVRIHDQTLSCPASSFVSDNGRKRGQIIGKVSQEAR